MWEKHTTDTRRSFGKDLGAAPQVWKREKRADTNLVADEPEGSSRGPSTLPRSVWSRPWATLSVHVVASPASHAALEVGGLSVHSSGGEHE